MDRARRALGAAPSSAAEYEPLTSAEDEPTPLESSVVLDTRDDDDVPFSWIEYTIFGFLGMAMLWAWYVPASLAIAPISCAS